MVWWWLGLSQDLARAPVTIRFCVTSAPGVWESIGNNQVIIIITTKKRVFQCSLVLYTTSYRFISPIWRHLGNSVCKWQKPKCNAQPIFCHIWHHISPRISEMNHSGGSLHCVIYDLHVLSYMWLHIPFIWLVHCLFLAEPEVVQPNMSNPCHIRRHIAFQCIIFSAYK